MYITRAWSKGGDPMSNLAEVTEYINQTKYLILATVGMKNFPGLRTLLSFANDGFSIYFSTGDSTEKVREITANPAVKLLFQHEGQELGTFQNITLSGYASPLEPDSAEYQKAVYLISARSPSFKARVEKGQLNGNTLFRVHPHKAKLLDFRKGIGPQAVEEVSLY
jgi:nitroimidazol reductase NimA-like FMN-containing flavoprotein (pyridoxamine 5'-phosphate oxidase superfamily)